MGRRLPVEPEDAEPPATLEDGATFRRASLDDAPAIAAADAAAYGDLAVRESVVRSWLERGHEFGLLERAGVLIGHAGWLKQGARGIVRRLGVRPDERRKGYGTAMLDRVADALARSAARRLELVVIPNPATIGFARANRLSQQGAGLAFRKTIGAKPEPTGAVIRGFGWSDMRRRR
jgi:GNAT superfamily N-acetyltransferase